MTGLEAMQAIADGTGEPPGIATTLGFELAEVGEGLAVFAMETGPHLLNPLGTVHGGIGATLLDSAMGCAVHTTLAQDEAYTTLELKVNYVRAIAPDAGRIQATGTVIHRGRRIATAEARLEDSGGRLLAHATCTCLVM
jgi:uncharacterized protein (TIGR00369 family)